MGKNRLKPHFQHSNCDSSHGTASRLFHFLLGVVFVDCQNMSDPGFWSGPGSPDCLTFPGPPVCHIFSEPTQQRNSQITCSDPGPTHLPQPIHHDSNYLKLFVKSNGLYPDAIESDPCKDLLASRTESSDLITWAHGEDPALYEKSIPRAAEVLPRLWPVREHQNINNRLCRRI